MKRFVCAISLILAITAANLDNLQPNASAYHAARRYVILASGQGPGSTAWAAEAVAAANGTVTRAMDTIGVVLAESADPDFAGAIAAHPSAPRIAEDVRVRWLPPGTMAIEATSTDLFPAGVNSEPLSGLQWNIRQIHADQTAALGYLGQGARVAVLDTGFNMTHADLAPNINTALARSFVPGEGVQSLFGGFSHGTHVAGIIAAAINNTGTQGVAPEAEIVPVKVLSDHDGSGEFGWLIAGIEYAASIGADVINMSLGATFDRRNAGGGGAGPILAALNRAVNHATASGVLVVSAAGNDASDLNGRIGVVPAQSGNGMAVSATGPIGFGTLGDAAIFDRLASYSNYGRSVINVAAPGGDFTLVPQPGWFRDLVLAPGSGTGSFYFYAAGTSQAAPHVCGVAALIIGRYGKQPPQQLKARIEQSADDILTPGADAQSGRGRINALAALQ